MKLYRCDRCSKIVEECAKLALNWKNKKIVMTPSGGKVRFEDDGVLNADLCDECTGDFHQWYKSKREDSTA